MKLNNSIIAGHIVSVMLFSTVSGIPVEASENMQEQPSPQTKINSHENSTMKQMHTREEFQRKSEQKKADFEQKAAENRADFERKKAENEANFNRKVEEGHRRFEEHSKKMDDDFKTAVAQNEKKAEDNRRYMIYWFAFCIIAAIAKWFFNKSHSRKSYRSSRSERTERGSSTSYHQQETEEERAEAIKAAGIQGEKETQFNLGFLPADYDVLNNVRLEAQGHSIRAEIDHLVLGPTGLFVVETKNYSGTIRMGKNGWTREKKYGELESLQSPSLQNFRHVRVLQDFINERHLPNVPVYSVVAMANPSVIIEGEDPHCEVLKAEAIVPWIMGHPGPKVSVEDCAKLRNALQ